MLSGVVGVPEWRRDCFAPAENGQKDCSWKDGECFLLYGFRHLRFPDETRQPRPLRLPLVRGHPVWKIFAEFSQYHTTKLAMITTIISPSRTSFPEADQQVAF